MSCDIKLKKPDRVYQPGEVVAGAVVVTSKGNMSHNGVTVAVDGIVTLQLSARSVGIFEAFYNQIAPVEVIKTQFEISKSGKLPGGVTELPFEFPLEPAAGQKLYETYHGVFVNVQYNISVEINRPMLKSKLKKTVEFIVEIPGQSRSYKPTAVPFTITPDSLENVSKSSRATVPKFKITGKLDAAVCPINKPFTGELRIEECDAPIKSIEVQLVRIETTGSSEGFAKEPTEIQNIQLADGNVCRDLAIPIYMIFPRLFTCPTVTTRTFKVEFEINIVVLFEDGHLITENFPIKLFRL